MLRAACIIIALATSANSAFSQDVGLVSGTFAATYVAFGNGCSSLLVTGQFVAPTPGYTIALSEASTQKTALIYELVLTATPPDGTVIQVLTPGNIRTMVELLIQRRNDDS